MKKILVFLCLFGFINQLSAGENSKKKFMHYLKNWEFSIGSNYSHFTSTDSDGKFGRNFSIYRNFNIYKRLNMKVGFSRSKVHLQAKNKTIRTHGMMGSGPYYLEHCRTIDFTYNFTLFNLFLDYKILSYKSVSFHPLLGIGFSAVDCDGNDKDIKLTEKSEDTLFSLADYDEYDEVLNIPETGTVIHYGMICQYRKLFFELYYSNHLYKIKEGGAYLEINEAMHHNYNASIGIVF